MNNYTQVNKYPTGVGLPPQITSAMQNTGCNAPTPASKVRSLTDELCKNLCVLEERIDFLKDRLGPVIFDPPLPEPPHGQPALMPAAMSIIAEDLSRHVTHVSRLLVKVEHILSVLEV